MSSRLSSPPSPNHHFTRPTCLTRRLHRDQGHRNTKKKLNKHTTTKCPSGQNFSHENFFILRLIRFESSRNSMGFLSLIASAFNDKFFSRFHYNLNKKNISWTYLVHRLFLSTNRNHHIFIHVYFDICQKLVSLILTTFEQRSDLENWLSYCWCQHSQKLVSFSKSNHQNQFHNFVETDFSFWPNGICHIGLESLYPANEGCGKATSWSVT